MICSASGHVLSIVLLLVAVILIAAALVIFILPLITNRLFFGRRDLTPARRAKRLARIQARPPRTSPEGVQAYSRAKRFMLKSDREGSPAYYPGMQRYLPAEVFIDGKYYRGKADKSVRLRAQICNCADLKEVPSFTDETQAATAVKEGKNWAIAVHGYREQGDERLLDAYFFMERGFNVLIPDLRGHGGSGGSYAGMGWHDRLDLLAWVNYLVETYPGCKILLFGVSMGAAAVMMASGEPLPSNVRCVIEDCGYTSVWDELKYQYKKRYHAPAFPILMQGSNYARLTYGYDFREASAIEQLRKNDKTPILFLHGGNDKFVPAKFAAELYAAAATPDKQLLVIDGAAHAESMHYDFARYWEKVDAFLNKYFSCSVVAK